MQPTSPAQFAASSSDSVPCLELVRESLYSLGVAFPGLVPHYTLSYLLLDDADGVHLVDPGWDSDENFHALEGVLAELSHGIRDVRTITVTHLHPDHLGMAARVREASGAVVALHALEQSAIEELTTPPLNIQASDTEAPDTDALARFTAWGVPEDRHPELLAAVHRRAAWKPVTADVLLADGDRLAIPGHDVRALHTPGHTTGHLALVDTARGVILTGDHLLPSQFPGIGLGGTAVGNPIDDYLRSLARVAEFDAFEALPGHGFRFRGIAERCHETAAHHERRSSEVAELASERSTVWDIASGLTWTAGWENLRGLELLSALSQTSLHRDRVSGHARADG